MLSLLPMSELYAVLNCPQPKCSEAREVKSWDFCDDEISVMMMKWIFISSPEVLFPISYFSHWNAASSGQGFTVRTNTFSNTTKSWKALVWLLQLIVVYCDKPLSSPWYWDKFSCFVFYYWQICGQQLQDLFLSLQITSLGAVGIKQLRPGHYWVDSTFGMGCFWKPSALLLKVPGVVDTIVGYTGKPDALKAAPMKLSIWAMIG